VACPLPHRDFGDAYTGLLTAYHAVAFAIGGHSLLTLRIALLVAFALWVPVYFAVVTRFVGLWGLRSLPQQPLPGVCPTIRRPCRHGSASSR
jgi:hypothetical protein